MDEKQIMELITSEFSWEQIIYKIIAWEGLDPWDLNISALCISFSNYIKKFDQLDFRIPAKYVIIAAILLRMKSDHLKFLDLEDESEQFDSFETEIEGSVEGVSTPNRLLINPITVPPKRMVRRKVTIEELVSSLRKALATCDRRDDRKAVRAGKINIRHEDISEKIANLYNKINSILKIIRKEEVEFTKVVDKWDKHTVVGTFVPLMHLDHEKKVACRQNDFFEEIYIKKMAK